MIKILSKSIKEYKKDAIITPLFVTVEVFLEVLIPLLMAFIIDKGLSAGDRNSIIHYGAYSIACIAVCLIFGVLAGKYSARGAAGFAKNLRRDMYSQIQDFSFENIDKFSTAGLITRLTTDVTNVQNAYHMILRILVKSPLMLIFSLFMAFQINRSLALIFLATIPVLGLGLWLITKYSHPLFDKVFKIYDQLNNMVQENVQGIRVVKSYVREDDERDKFQGISEKIFRTYTKAEKMVANNSPLMQLVMYATILLICWIGAQLIVTDQMTTGQLSSMIAYAVQILVSLMMLSMVYVMVLIANTSAKRIAEVLQEESSLRNPAEPLMTIKDGTVEFEKVGFSYEDDPNKLELKPTSFTIHSGETVGIVGATGSGKSSLVQLMPRLYDTTVGKVKIGGHNVKKYDLTVLRDEVAIVLQKNVLFSGTIKENLRWGNAEATDAELIHVCKLAQADGFISQFPDGYDTYIEQGGMNVSGGQKQRLCIARALLKNPKILIFDDSTSAVDTKTDALIRQAFRAELPSVTKFIISQRISSVEDSDQIIVMDRGRIVAIGTHEELCETCELYQEMYESQQKGGQEHAA